jgi:hypothetical protein
MRDPTPDPKSSDVDLAAEAAYCPGSVCGPIFETSLVELVFRRVRLLAGRGTATQAVELGADPDPRPRPVHGPIGPTQHRSPPRGCLS